MRPRRPKPTKASPRSSKSRHARKRVKYTEPASDPEDDIDSEASYEPEETPSPPRPTRSTAPLPTARPQTKPRKRKRKDAMNGAHISGSRLPQKSKGNERPMRPLGYTRFKGREKSESGKKTVDIHFTGKAMPLHTLPYHVLQLVFDYASYPLIAENFAPNPSVAWLFKIARLCKSFTEPALTALYTSPPLFPPSRVRRLIDGK